MKKNSTYWISRISYGYAGIAFIGICTGATWHWVTCLMAIFLGFMCNLEWHEEMKEAGNE